MNTLLADEERTNDFIPDEPRKG